MADGMETVLKAYGFAKAPNFLVAELHDLAARRAMKVVVRGIPVIVLVCAAVGQPELTQQTGINKEPERAVNGGSTDAAAGMMKLGDEFIGVKVLMSIEDVPHQDATWLGQFLPPDFQEFAEFILRPFGDRDGTDFIGIGHVLHPRPSAGSDVVPSRPGTL
ncbi:MAG: hypothetical protein NVSMB9_09530 [Isosphaeraceae bacterium]